MAMEIKVIKNREQWDGWFLARSEPHSFTQSWAWGDILIAEGKRIERLAVIEGDMVLAQAQVVYTPIFFGWQYAFCPKGPVLDESRIKNYELRIYETVINYFKKQNVLFFRVEPRFKIQNSKFEINRSIDISPPATLLLDLNKSADQLLAGMHPKTRYNISLAKKKNMKISLEKNLDVFWNLMNKTGSRDKFGLHHKGHYAAVLASKAVSQLTAYHDAVPVACAVFIGFGNTFTYLYGASDYAYRNLMAPYLLQWEGMEIGNDFGSKWYDFFGVAPRQQSASSAVIPTKEESLSDQNENGQRSFAKAQDDSYEYDSKHQYAGVTRFKVGFGGVPYEDPGTFDVVISKYKYDLYKLLRRLRRLF
jgi:peptidoglycan pentaglycine glycine transferase (the first glycine)